MLKSNLKQELIAKVEKKKDVLIDLCAQMVKIPSESPESDTRELANYIAGILKQVDGAEVTLHTLEAPIVNVVARIKGNAPGKRLILNGHLDTFPVGDISSWAVDPFSALQKDGRMYGRGVSDMKGGIASYLLTFILMAEMRESWAGELVMTLGGDEENMGIRGTKFLLDTVPHATGDAMISSDVGIAKVLRFGEKGLMWVKLDAVGKASHGAHVHQGKNAINRLVEGISILNKELEKLNVNAPEQVTKAILASSEQSEKYAGKGETEVLQKVTINFGVIEGGVSPNLIPAKASVQGDIRIPVGIELEEVEQKVKEVVDAIEGLSYTIFNQYAANFSDINHEIFSITSRNVAYINGEAPVLTMRVGASDARHYRISKNVPSVNCGLNPYNLGAADEYIEINELVDVAKIHLLSTLEYLGVRD